MPIECALFLIIAQPRTNGNLKTFRVKESFWDQKQSFLLWKVGLRKWCPFFVFVYFNGCHFTKSEFAKKDTTHCYFIFQSRRGMPSFNGLLMRPMGFDYEKKLEASLLHDRSSNCLLSWLLNFFHNQIPWDTQAHYKLGMSFLLWKMLTK